MAVEDLVQESEVIVISVPWAADKQAAMGLADTMKVAG
jgi:hypothetical protein